MFRTDADGATVDHKFTEGNPALSVPATVVDAEWLNDVQEELAYLPEIVGIALAKNTQNQVYLAIRELFRRGGRPAPVIQAIANTQASQADITDMHTFLTTAVVAFELFYSIYRRTDAGQVKESGRLYGTWNSDTSTWELTKLSVHDDAGVVFYMTLTSTANTYKLQYTSDTQAGASYAGTLRITDIVLMRKEA